MYTPSSDDRGIPNKKMWVVWKVRRNTSLSTSWLAKEDCPSTIHNTYDSAMKEADRLSTKTNEVFLVFEAVATFAPRPLPKPEYHSDVRLLTAH